jgi:hypothetical protein
MVWELTVLTTLLLLVACGGGTQSTLNAVATGVMVTRLAAATLTSIPLPLRPTGAARGPYGWSVSMVAGWPNCSSFPRP